MVRRLAVGGMAEIFLAEARGIEGFAKYVVLKRILPQFAQSETFVRLFLNEARVSATLDHPNIATVYDIGEADGVFFFTMEYLHGEDLGHLLRELVNRQKRLPLEHALTIGVGVAAGLHAAHEKRGPDGRPLGIVHRDVSPSNVVVTYDGGIKLCDFGVAKITSQADLTRTGTLKGKVSYMSPEQCNNESLDRRSDIFALGVLLYELTTQSRLFRGDSEAATLKLVLDAKIPPPSSRVPGYPPDLEATILKALHKDREDRYATAREMQIALEEVARAHGLLTSAASLGAFMTNNFGPKVEPWLMPPEESSARSVGGDGPRRHTLDRGPVLRTLIVEEQPPGRRSRLAWPWVAGGALLLLAVATATGLAIERAKAPRLTATPPSAGPPSPEGPTPGLPPPLDRSHVGKAGGSEAIPTGTSTAPARGGSGRRASARPALTRTAPQRFSEIFARKEPALLRCFAAHPSEAAAAPEISVRFRVGLQGEVLSADVLPPALAGTGLGSCVAGVARDTRFGQQNEPVTLRIPVSVRRVSGDRRR